MLRLINCLESLKKQNFNTAHVMWNHPDDDLNSNTETDWNSEVNELEILYNAAIILHIKRQEIPKLSLRLATIGIWIDNGKCAKSYIM